tara:strand:- start:314 stop:892 length:579 start_codon:yes stop_codon:yes gene_type:complete
MNRKLFFVGKNVKIRLININDYKDLKRWDPEGSNSFNYFPNSDFLNEIKDKRWIENKIKDKNGLYFVILKLDTSEVIGITILENIDLKNKNACWGIYIAYPEYRKLIYSLQPSFLIIDYAFSKLKLNKLYGNSLPTNKRGRKFHKLLGFSEEAIFNKQILVNEVYQDLIWISMLSKNWTSKRGELLKLINSC